MYACGPGWSADWLSEEDLRDILEILARHIVPAEAGANTIGLNHGLHFTGGEPFLNYDLLCRGVEIATELGIPSTFVETNCFWCSDSRTVRGRLKELKNKGMVGIMISVNPFYLEFVPFERTRLCIECSLEVFGSNVDVYQVEYYRRFMQLGITDRVPLQKYLEMDGSDAFLRGVEFFMQGRAPYALPQVLEGGGGEIFGLAAPEDFFGQRCTPSPARSWHNHFDNYGNYVPGYCGGISYGDVRELGELLNQGVDPAGKPILSFIMEEDIEGLFHFAEERGYSPASHGYCSRCHLCTDIRKYLAETGNFAELQPREFYQHLSQPSPSQSRLSHAKKSE